MLAVTALLILTSFPLTALAADCSHMPGTNYTYRSNGDSTHTVYVNCTKCKEEYPLSDPVACEYVLGICKVCGASEPKPECAHTNTVRNVSADGSGRDVHMVLVQCTSCWAILSSSEESCTFSEGVCECGNTCPHAFEDGVCRICGLICSHEYSEDNLSFSSNDDGTHVVSCECSVCGYIDSYEHSCTFTAAGDCIHCGYKRECAHENITVEYGSSNDVGFHMKNVGCLDCGLWTKTKESCSYVDGFCEHCGVECFHQYSDGKCTKCGMKQPSNVPDLNLPELEFATYGTPIWEKDVKYLKTDKGFYFVVSDDYIGGKNIFNLEDHGLWLPGNSILTLLDSRYDYLYFSDPGTASPYGRFTVKLKDLSKFEDRQKYTFSCLASDSKADVYLHVTDPSGKISYVYSENDNGLVTMTFEYLKENEYTIIFRTDNNRTVARPAYTVLFKRLQIEKGEKFTAYEPYYAVRCYDYETTYKKGYQDALLENGGNTGGLISGIIDSGYNITKDAFDILNKGTTLNGISLGGLITTAIALFLAFWLLKIIKK